MSALVYVVDDDERCRRLVGDVAAHHGHRVELFPNGQQVIDRIQQQEPDLLIVDIHMPGMTGLDVLRWVRERALRLPVVAMTTSMMPSQRSELAQAGFATYLSKPLSLVELGEVIKEQLASGGSAA
jgi:CheY-like chemotaxis protein